MNIISDILNIITNYLPLNIIIRNKLISTDFKNFIDRDLVLEHFIFVKDYKSFNAFNGEYLGLMRKHILNLVKIYIDIGIHLTTGSVYQTNDQIVDRDIKNARKLKILMLPGNINISDEGLCCLSNLEIVNLRSNKLVTNNGLVNSKNIKNITTMYINSKPFELIII